MADEFDENGDPDDEMSPEELREQLAAERAARAVEREARERNERRLDEMLRSSPRQESKAPAPLGPPPNAVDDPEGFQRWMVERDARQQRELDARFKREREEVTQTMSTENRVALLWERFRTKYPAYASKTRLVEVAYGDLVSRGALPADNERAVDAVKREMDVMAGLADDPAGNRTDDPSRGARPVRARKRGAPEDERPKSMADAIYEQQVKAGLR